MIAQRQQPVRRVLSGAGALCRALAVLHNSRGDFSILGQLSAIATASPGPPLLRRRTP